VILVLSGAAGWVLFSRPAFNPDAVGKAEAKMWQSYYTGNQPQLVLQLVQLLRKQYGLTAVEAAHVGEQFADAAMTFSSAREDYDAKILPSLTRGYTALKEASGSDFDPAQVARAELAWWVARRMPNEDSVENVGAKISELYATLYGGSHPALLEAGLLRARAAHLRDLGGENADWAEVESLLVQSYATLAEAM
jgi:hypothetical protein